MSKMYLLLLLAAKENVPLHGKNNAKYFSKVLLLPSAPSSFLPIERAHWTLFSTFEHFIGYHCLFSISFVALCHCRPGAALLVSPFFAFQLNADIVADKNPIPNENFNLFSFNTSRHYAYPDRSRSFQSTQIYRREAERGRKKPLNHFGHCRSEFSQFTGGSDKDKSQFSAMIQFFCVPHTRLRFCGISQSESLQAAFSCDEIVAGFCNEYSAWVAEMASQRTWNRYDCYALLFIHNCVLDSLFLLQLSCSAYSYIKPFRVI